MKYWGRTEVYLKNRWQSKSLARVTPYESWFGQKTQVKHLRVFGCDAYAHILEDERGKLNSKARRLDILVNLRDTGYMTQSGEKLY